MTATPEQLAFLQAINAQVNAIPYEALGKDSSGDNWIDAPQPGSVWECRDYTIAKAKLMREQGWPIDGMGVVLCNTEAFSEHGEPAQRYYHAVQFARATSDVYILDNRTPHIYLWSTPPYDYQWVYQEIIANGAMSWRDAKAGLV